MSEDDWLTQSQFLIGALARAQREEKTMHMPSIGHNKPPNTKVIRSLALAALQALSAFLRDTPVIRDAAEARLANEHCDSIQRTIKDIEAERKSLVEPLKTQAKSIDEQYRVIRQPLEHALDTLKERLTQYVIIETRKREDEARRLREEAEAKERAAREAERLEKEAQANAEVGECTDVGEAIAAADAAFNAFTDAERAAAIAERDSQVRLRSMYGGRARTLRTSEVLHVVDASAALTAMGVTESIRDAILTSARAYRKLHGRLPAGISREEIRSL
jgi:hypothetical protein